MKKEEKLAAEAYLSVCTQCSAPVSAFLRCADGSEGSDVSTTLKPLEPQPARSGLSNIMKRKQEPAPPPPPVPNVLSLWSQKDVELSRTKRVAKQHIWVPAVDAFVSSPFPCTEDAIATSVSPSGRFIARLYHKNGGAGANPPASAFKKAVGTPAGETDGWIEVWSDSYLLATIDTSEAHGAFCTDEWFGGLSWSASETKLAYVAERRASVKASYWKKQTSSSSSKGSGEKSKKIGDAFEKELSFGECFEGVSSPTLFIAELNTGSVERAHGVPDRLAVGDPQFSPTDESTLFFHAVEAEPTTQLGIRYCYNRRSSIYSLSLEPPARDDGDDGHESNEPERIVCLTEDGRDDIDFCARSPRPHPSGRFVVYLSTPKSARNTHMATSVLRVVDSASGDASTLVDVPESPCARGDFPGIYAQVLPASIFVSEFVLCFDTIWSFQVVPMVLQVEYDLASSGLRVAPGEHSLEHLLSSEAEESASILDVNSGFVVLALSTPRKPHWLEVVNMLDPARVCYTLFSWSSSSVDFSSLVEVSSVESLALKNEAGTEFASNADDDPNRFEALLIAPSESLLADLKNGEDDLSEGVPLVCMPHGGPHSAFVACFNPSVAAMALCGVAVVMVNFRGSLGLGEASLQSLPGRVGDQDVAECLAATEWALRTDSRLNRGKVGVLGGSHGGFLGAHLSAQRAGLFRAAVLRNPVVNVATMCGATDIPDWCYAECGVAEPSAALSSDIMMRMLLRSPIVHYQNVRAPTLLQLGENDKRVPPQQGLEWQRALRSIGTTCDVSWYPNSAHALAEAPANDHAVVQGIAWLLDHLNAFK